jgi:capsular exopolysaccharide synthesis family protein
LRAKQTLQRGLGVLRRHALVSVAVLIVVTAAGIVYVRRQVPTYRATTQLVVERRSAALEDVPESVSFLEDTTYMATQRYILTHDRKIAEEVLQRLDEDPDPAGVAALLAGIRVDQEPGTLVVKLSFEGPDPARATEVVNRYADVYVERNESEQVGRAGAILDEVRALHKSAAQAERDARRALDDFSHANSDIAVTTGENPHLALAQQYRSQLALDEVQLIDLSKEEEELGAVLARHGVGLVRTDGPEAEADVTLSYEGTREELETLLRTEPEILRLPAVDRSANVADLRARVRDARSEEQRLLTEYREQHERVRDVRRRLEEAQTALGAEVRAAIHDFLREVSRLRSRLVEVRARYEAAEAASRRVNEKLAEYRTLTTKAEDASAVVTDLRVRLASAQKTYDEATNQRLERIKVFLPALSAPLVRPNAMLIYLLTGFAAVFLSVGSAVLLGYLDDTIKSKDDFERLFGERLPFIGYVPRISRKEFDRPDLATFDHPQAAVSEAFRSVRTSILLSRSGRELQSLLITSASPGEGKTTMAVNLAVTMARSGGRVLLVDADLRRSRIHAALDIPRGRGLTAVLAGAATLDAAVQTVHLESDAAGGRRRETVEFDALTCGEIPPNPAELLGSEEMKALLAEARGRYDKIILDTPPLVAVTDACVLSRLVDGVFTVISVGKTSWRLVRTGLEDLEQVDAPVRGAILNALSASGGGYGYYDSYHYRNYRYETGSRKRQPAETSS